MKTSCYYVYGIDCAACADRIEKTIAEDSRVNTASLDFASKRLELSSKSDLSAEEIQKLVDSCEDGCRVEKEKKEDEEGRRFKVKLISTGFRAAVSLVLAILGLTVLREASVDLYWNLAVMGAAYIISAYDIFYKAFIDIFKHKNFFDENVLMVIATLGAFAMRFFGDAHNEFFEAVMVVVLYQIGELFETFATGKSHKAIIDAVGLKAKQARLVGEDGTVTLVKPEAINVGDTLEIRVGDLLPVDAVVVKGEGTLDESSLTGEFLPRAIKVGEAVKAGTLLVSGSLILKASARYEDSSVAKILDLVESGNAKKSKVDRFTSKFSRIYTPVVILIGLVLAVVPPLVIGPSDPAVWERWIYTALSALVISCPCAIVISVPLSYFAGLGLASKLGIVIKGSDNFDTLNETKTLFVDKTGTLTEGKFNLEKVVTSDNEEDFLKYLKAAESRSSHPLALAVMGKEDPGTYSKDVTSYEEIAGKGIKAVYQGHEILSGNANFLKESGIEIAFSEDTGTSIHLAVDGKYLGYALLDDTIRQDSKTLVDELHARNMKIYLLTGDNEKAASKLAKKLGLDGYKAGLTPEGKTQAMLSLKGNDKVAYLGDGINDAPTIVAADIGFAMGEIGSDLAIENADAIIMQDNPLEFIEAVDVAKKTRRKAITNIAAALVVKAAFLIMSLAIPSFPLYIAVLADTGLTAILILNALLLLRSGKKTKKVESEKPIEAQIG